MHRHFWSFLPCELAIDSVSKSQQWPESLLIPHSTEPAVYSGEQFPESCVFSWKELRRPGHATRLQPAAGAPHGAGPLAHFSPSKQPDATTPLIPSERLSQISARSIDKMSSDEVSQKLTISVQFCGKMCTFQLWRCLSKMQLWRMSSHSTVTVAATGLIFCGRRWRNSQILWSKWTICW